MKYFILLISVFVISCTSPDNNNNDVCDPNPCKDSQIAYKTICEAVEGDDSASPTDFKCVCEDGFSEEDGICKKESVEECTEGATKCNFDDLLTCASNEWNRFDCTLNDKKCETSNNSSSCISEVVEDGTIYPIRTGEVAQESQVTVKAIINAVRVGDNLLIDGLYIQETGADYRGIYVYAKNKLQNTFSTGDEVTVSGVYKEYNGLSEIVVEADTDVVKTTVFSPISDFKLLNIDSLSSQRVEEYESMLVAVKGVFTVGDRDDSFNLQIKDEAGTTFLIRDDLYLTELSKDDKLSEVRGVLSYNYNKFKILPRGDYDLIDNTEICAQVSCINSEVCEVTAGVPACICDEQRGYFDDSGVCKNPCLVNGVCIEENRHTCIPSDAINFICVCDSGFEEDDTNTCIAAQYCDTATYGSAFALTGTALADELKIIVNRNFSSYGYDDGRIAMFSYIDNDNGTIQCIYTGEHASHPYVDDMSLLHKGCDGCADKPDNNVWNWEHTWPSSMLSVSAAKCDLHHLFPTRAYVNSRRSNYPFGDVDAGDKFCDDGNDSSSNCIDYDYVSELKNSIFEVADQHKGDTARAMFYMLIKYKNLNDHLNDTQFTVLRAWNLFDEVDEKERTRNDKVEMFQHNRNPFVDCPQFVDALYGE